MKRKVLKLRPIMPQSIKITPWRTIEGSLPEKHNPIGFESQQSLALFPFRIDLGLHFIPGPQWASNCENDSIYKIHLIKEINWVFKMKGRGEVERPAEPTRVTKHKEAPETPTWTERKKNPSKRDGRKERLKFKAKAFKVLGVQHFESGKSMKILWTSWSDQSLCITDPWNYFLCWCSKKTEISLSENAQKFYF